MILQSEAKQAIIDELRACVGSAGTMDIAERMVFRMEMLRKYPFRSKAKPDQLIATWIESYFDHRLPA
jgi:hypothetical protein